MSELTNFDLVGSPENILGVADEIAECCMWPMQFSSEEAVTHAEQKAKKQSRIAQRDRIIAHNRKIYKDRVGGNIWFEKKNQNGEYVRYSGGVVTKKEQQGRWETKRLSGHRRYAKWCRDYYPSLQKEKRNIWDKADTQIKSHDVVSDEEMKYMSDDFFGAFERKEKAEAEKAERALAEKEFELEKFKAAHKDIIDEYVRLINEYNDALEEFRWL